MSRSFYLHFVLALTATLALNHGLIPSPHTRPPCFRRLEGMSVSPAPKRGVRDAEHVLRSCSLGACTQAPGKTLFAGKQPSSHIFPRSALLPLGKPHGSPSCACRDCGMLYPAAHIVLLQCGGVSLENMSELAPRPVVTRKSLFPRLAGCLWAY